MGTAEQRIPELNGQHSTYHQFDGRRMIKQKRID
jgi:hypothetical protein